MPVARNHVVRHAGLVLEFVFYFVVYNSERRRDEARLPAGYTGYYRYPDED